MPVSRTLTAVWAQLDLVGCRRRPKLAGPLVTLVRTTAWAGVFPLTDDHTLFRSCKTGQISEEEQEGHPQRNILTLSSVLMKLPFLTCRR